MKIEYRKLSLLDSDKIRIWRNKQLSILRQNQTISKEKQTTYFKKKILCKNDQIKLFAIDLDKTLIAYGGLVNISKDFGTAEVSFLVDDDIGPESEFYEILFKNFLDFIEKYSFKKKNLRRLFTETYSFRKKHIKILEKKGFILEGVLKKHVIKNNRIYDSLIHAKLKK